MKKENFKKAIRQFNIAEKNNDINLVRLCQQGILRGYPVLRDIPGSFVSQTEHTVIVTEDGCITTTA